MDDPDVELRGGCPRSIIDVIDAVSNAKLLTRTQMVNLILAQWVAEKMRETERINRVTRCDSGGGAR